MSNDSGSDDNGGDDHGGHDFEDGDEREDHNLDDNSHSFSATFTVTFVTGQTVTGHLNVSHGLLLGDFTLNGVVFHFRDGSLDDETTVFSQRGTFRLISDHHIQRGPSFPKPIDVFIDAVTGKVTSHAEDGTIREDRLDFRLTCRMVCHLTCY